MPILRYKNQAPSSTRRISGRTCRIRSLEAGGVGTVIRYHNDGGLYGFGELATLAQLAQLAKRNIKVIAIVDHNGGLLANRTGMAA